jgi:hypothetical protein
MPVVDKVGRLLTFIELKYSYRSRKQFFAAAPIYRGSPHAKQ